MLMAASLRFPKSLNATGLTDSTETGPAANSSDFSGAFLNPDTVCEPFLLTR
jgi:hypothetical protein